MFFFFKHRFWSQVGIFGDIFCYKSLVCDSSIFAIYWAGGAEGLFKDFSILPSYKKQIFLIIKSIKRPLFTLKISGVLSTVCQESDVNVRVFPHPWHKVCGQLSPPFLRGCPWGFPHDKIRCPSCYHTKNTSCGKSIFYSKFIMWLWQQVSIKFTCLALI